MLWFILILCLVLGWAAWGWAALESNVKTSKWDMTTKSSVTRIWEFVQTHPPIIVGVISLAVALIGHYSLYKGANLWKFTQDFYNNYFAEIIGMIMTVYLIDRLNQIREERREAQLEKERLIIQTRSVDKNEAVLAIRRLGQRGWLPDVNLEYVNLGTCDLSAANLNRANLMRGNLRGADLSGAKLSEANLRGADLRGSDLRGSDLSKAKYDSNTLWPEGFDPQVAGAINVEKDDAMSEKGNTP